MLSRACVLLSFLLAGPAAAQSSFDVQLFRPSPHADAFFSAESGAISPDLLQAQVLFNYAYRPLELISTKGVRQSGIVDHLFDADFMVSAALFRRLSLALTIPASFYESGSAPVVGKLPAVNFRDMALDAKVGILDAARFYIDVAASIGLSVPTGNNKAFSGDKSVTFYPELDISRKIGPVRIAGNGGYLWRQQTVIYNLTVGPELYFKSGLGLDLKWLLERAGKAAPAIELIGELYGRTSAIHPFSLGSQNPMEWDAGVKWRFFTHFIVNGGVGRGILPGYGAAAFRAFLGLAYVPFVHEEEKPAPASAPVVVVLPPPPPPPPPPDRDNDGIPDSADKCPDIPEDKNGFQDDDGCPDQDTDKDSVPDYLDKCPNEPQGPAGKDGCPSQGPVLVKLTKKSISILQKVQFATNSAEILGESSNLLNQVAYVLKTHPELTKVIVEGHTDNVGGAEHNLQLSQRRAASVVEFLVNAGVERERLEPHGYGLTKPIASNGNKRGREANRRVNFTIPTPAADTK